MAFRIPTVLQYKGTEQYKPKNRENTVTLHRFVNSDGQEYKTKLKEDFVCDIDAKCACVFLDGDKRLNDGTYKHYCFMSSVEPIKDSKRG